MNILDQFEEEETPKNNEKKEDRGPCKCKNFAIKSAIFTRRLQTDIAVIFQKKFC